MYKLNSIPWQLDTRRLAFYLWMLGFAIAALLVYAALEKPLRYTMMVASLPIVLILITSPRLALYQFVLLLFVDFAIIPSIPLYVLDVSAVILICAALVDLLLDDHVPARLPPLTSNYLLILAAMLVCSLHGYMPEILPRRVIAYLVMVATFLSVVRLSRKVPVAELLKAYVLVASLFSAIALAGFVATGGSERSFGLTNVYQDEFSMTGTVISFALLLGYPGKKALLFRLTTLLCLGGLLATQSRAPIAIAGASMVLLALVVRYRTRPTLAEGGVFRLMRSRLKESFVYVVVLGIVVVVASSGLTAGLSERFSELFEARATGTTVYRLLLWENALKAFWDHPVLGIGFGVYHYIGQVYPTWHLTEHLPFVRNLSAHNVFLQYLAEMGLVGGLVLGALMAAKIRIAARCWQPMKPENFGTSLALMAWAILFAVSILTEAGWMWGHLSFTAVFFAALLSRHYLRTVN